MALIFNRQYYLDFDTTTGQDIKWTLEIWRSYDDADPTPPWVGTETKLAGTLNPIEIEWERDYDVYKPIIGSKAKVNLLVENAGQYADFNDAGPFEYQVRLKYTDDNDTLQDYWRGYITPLDGKESVSTFPFQVSYTATDGLGLLEQVVTRIPQSLNDVKAWDSVTEALYQTGLDLDIYLDSGIKTALVPPVTASNAIEAVSEVSVDSAWIYKSDDLTERLTGKEIIEGVLSAFNCTIKQSNGKWYITNASTYGGTTDSATFDVYNVVTNVYSKNATPVTETLRYTIDGTETQGLVPAGADLVLNTRRPYGSVECKPKGLFAESVKNGGFELVNNNGEPLGWSAGPTEGPLQTSTDIHFEGERSLVTEHNTLRVDNSVNDTWFMNTEGIEVDGSGTFEVGFDWLGDILIDSGSEGIRNIHLNYEVFFVPDNNTFTGFLSGYDPREFTVQQNSLVQAFFWNQTDNEWMPVLTTSIYGFYSNEALAEGGDLGQWLREDLTMPAVRYWDYASGDPAGVPAGEGKLYIRVYFPGGQKDNGLRNDFRGNGDGRLRVFVDNVSARNVFANEIDNPVFERLQDSYTSTYDYEPSLLSSGNDAIVQKVSSTEYIRTNSPLDPDNSNIPVDITTNKTLEEIGTQLKLNDFRSQFKYYEGNLINLTSTPLSPHHKVRINWQGYSETESCIINGGRFNVKSNQFDIAMYVPNQATDVAPGEGVVTDGVLGPGFYPYNIDLEAMQFPGISTKRTYRLDVIGTTKDADGNDIITELVGLQKSYLWIEEPGKMIPIEINLQAPADKTAVSGMSSTTAPAPEQLSDIRYTNNYTDLRVNAVLTIPDHSAFETLNIASAIDDFTPEGTNTAVNNTITFTRFSDPAIALPQGSPNPLVTVFTVRGVQGDTKTIVYPISAVSDNLVQNIDEEHTDGLLGNGVTTGNGTQSATITFDYRMSGTDGYNVPVTITGNTSGGGGGVDIQNCTLTITNNLDGVDVVDGVTTGNTTVVPFDGVIGEEVFRNINLDPDPDKYISEIGTPTISDAAVVRIETPSDSGEDWKIPTYFKIIDENATQPTMTIAADGGIVLEEPYSISFNVNNLGLNNSTIPVPVYTVNGESFNKITFDEEDMTNPATSFPRAGESYLVTVKPTGNHVFTSVNDISIDINEAAATVTTTVDGMTNTVTRALPEIQFSPGTRTLQPDGSIVFPVTGLFPTPSQGGGQYVLDINIIGSSTSNDGMGDGPTLKPATAAGTTVNIINQWSKLCWRCCSIRSSRRRSLEC